VGVANARSLATAIARACRREGAELALTFQNERLEPSVRALAGELGATIVEPCDVTRDEQVTALATRVEAAWVRLDFLVHAVATARREELEGAFLDTTRDGFAMALDVSVYSLVALARAFAPLLERGEGAPSILTLSYLGGERVVPNYNVMGVAKAALDASVRYLAADLGPRGVRVNALSPGPLRTLSAAGIRGLRTMLSLVESAAPLRRNVSTDEVGDAALFALSPLGRAMTGEVVHVDAGFGIMATPPWPSE
jgi:enoyl-[acyl-carrier protein] reductase I